MIINTELELKAGMVIFVCPLHGMSAGRMKVLDKITEKYPTKVTKYKVHNAYKLYVCLDQSIAHLWSFKDNCVVLNSKEISHINKFKDYFKYVLVGDEKRTRATKKYPVLLIKKEAISPDQQVLLHNLTINSKRTTPSLLAITLKDTTVIDILKLANINISEHIFAL